MKATTLDELQEVLHYSNEDIRLSSIYVKDVDMTSLLKDTDYNSLDLSFSVFENCSFDGLDLSKADFYNAEFHNCSLVDSKLKGSNFELAKLENTTLQKIGLLQRKKGVELELALPRYQVLFMHNNEERKALATQVEDLTNGKHRFGDFQFEDGFAINKDSKMVIVLPEKSLHERALFKQVRESFDFGYDADKLVPSFKSDPSLINYGVRENNNLGLTHFNGKTYRVFKENAMAVGDSPTAIMLELDKSKVDEKLSNSLEATDLRISGDTVYQTYRSKSEPNKSFIIEVNLKDLSKETVRNEKHLTDFCKNHRGSKSLSEFSSSLKEDLKEHTLLKFETHSSKLKAEEKKRLRTRNDLRQDVSQDVEQKQTRRSKLRN